MISLHSQLNKRFQEKLEDKAGIWGWRTKKQTKKKKKKIQKSEKERKNSTGDQDFKVQN